MGSARVRPPRLQIEGQELDAAQKIISQALSTRPVIARKA
jgi:hypothetical protein